MATGQHEIDFRYADALTTADNLTTFKFVVRNVASRFGYIASFMPKPIEGINGSGMHTHQSLFRGKENAFYDPKAEYQLSQTALSYIEGLLKRSGRSDNAARGRAQILYWAFVGFALSDQPLPPAKQRVVLDQLLDIATR